MDYKVLYRKYRPDNFGDLVGQNHITELLINSIKNNKLSHAYLFTGPRGTGKTSTAKLFAKVINCDNSNDGYPCNECLNCKNYNESTDIVEIDAASNNGVDKIRELRDNVEILPAFSKYKVYIIDEVHMLTTSSWNAFLKTLEEPPSHVIFILATTEIQKVPITILSRCQRFDFRRITEEVIINKLEEIAKKEKINIDKEVLREIALLSEGGLRDALGILDQLSKAEEKITVETLEKTYGLISNKELDEFIDKYKDGNVSFIIEKIVSISGRGVPSELFLKKLLDKLLLTLIDEKINLNFSGIKFDKLIIELEQAYKTKNQYLIIKAILLKNINTNAKIDSDLPDNQKEISVIKNENKIIAAEENKIEEKPEIISREIIFEKEVNSLDEEILKIRINNSFFEADKALKKEFALKWHDLTNHCCNNGDMKYMSILKNTNVEVVSPTNVILSTSSDGNAVLFNSICDEIVDKYKKTLGNNIKLVCLSKENWEKEKEKYIKKSKTENYEYIKEPARKKNTKIINKTLETFEEKLIEVK